MKKSTIVTFVAALIILSACQNATDTTKNAADRAKEEKAVTTSQVNLVVNPPAGEPVITPITPPPKPTPTPLPEPTPTPTPY